MASLHLRNVDPAHLARLKVEAAQAGVTLRSLCLARLLGDPPPLPQQAPSQVQPLPPQPTPRRSLPPQPDPAAADNPAELHVVVDEYSEYYRPDPDTPF
jgi:hypothetical protein